MVCATGAPSEAYPIAGRSRDFHGSLPYRLCSSDHASTVPGTDTEIAPAVGSTPFFARLRAVERLRFAGLWPEPLMPTTLRSFVSHNIAKQSPPIPLAVGSSTPRHEFAVI